MKDHDRKCFKCGRSPAKDPNVKLYRFPQPGIRNALRCELWAKYCFPEKECSREFQLKLYSEHRMLCDQHFKPSAFIDFETKKLLRDAVPQDGIKRVVINVPNAEEQTSDPQKSVLSDITNKPAELEVSTVEASSKGELARLVSAGQQTAGPSRTVTNKPADMDVSTEKASSKGVLVSAGEPIAGPSRMVTNKPADMGISTEKASTKGVLVNTGEQIAGLLRMVTNKPADMDVSTKKASSKEVLDSAGEQIAGPSRMVTNKPADMDISTKEVSLKGVLVNLDSAGKQIAGLSKAIINKPAEMAVSTKEASSKISVTKSKKYTLVYKKLQNHMKKVARLQKTVSKLKGESFINAISDNNAVKKVLSNKLTSYFAVLLQAQIRNTKRKPRGRRWTEDDKIIALRLYRRSPAGYRLLRRLFSLPSQTTLKNLLKQLPMDVGPNKKVFEVLNLNFNSAQPEDKECVLMFDEMSIKKHLSYNKASDQIEGFQDHGLIQGRTDEIATHALVFMISGIRKKFKQPVAYYISGDHVTADRLVVLIKEVLGHCYQAQINVSVIICDQDGVNRRAMNILGVTADKPYFQYEHQEIVAMYDTPHLLKSFRNLFLKYDIRCRMGIGDEHGHGVASWGHLKLFFEKDNQNPNFVYAPALTKAHLEPNQKQKMKVRLAAQIMSHSVAAGLFALAGTGHLPQAATITATMVSKIDKLFDAVNADTPDLKKGKPYHTNYSDRSKHKELFKDLKDFFQSLELIGARARPPSLDGWIQSMAAIERLWKNIKTKHPDIGSLATRRLQQDPIENLFGCIRANCGSNCNPTVGQFIGALKTSILCNLSAVGLANKNCEDDDCKILNNLKTLLRKKEDVTPVVISDTDSNGIFDDDLPEFEPNVVPNPELQACAYVCGYIVKRIEKNTPCQMCNSLFVSADVGLEHMFCEFREFSEMQRSLKYASKDLISCVEFCATQINNFLKENAHAENLFKSCLNELNSSPNFRFLQKCNSHYEQNKRNIITNVFFICIKRFTTLKNRTFSEQAALHSVKKKIDILKHI